jgi:peptidoglycan/LPS O-acetylase OafA/YrhL
VLTSSRPHASYRPDIDGLRGVAVLAVVANHFQPGRVTGGFVGVDVFFVISGFLITGILIQQLQAGTFSLADFYARRVRRLFPALSLVLLVSFIAGWFLLDPIALTDLGANAAAGAGFVSNLLLWSQTGYFDPEAQAKPMLHLWSLGIEEQYYALWPLFLFALWKVRFRLVPIAAIAAASFALNAVFSATRPTAAFYSPATRIWELLLGCMIAYVGLTRGEPIALLSRFGGGGDTAVLRGRESQLRELSGWVGFALVCAAILGLTEDFTLPGFWVLLPTIGAALLICAGPETWINRKVLSNRVMVFVGLISYPLYLWHWPVLALIHIRGWNATRAARAEMMLAALVGVFIAAWLTYKAIEKPIRKSRSGRVIAGLSLAQALLFVFGIALVGLRGIPGRYDAAHQQLFAIARKPPTYTAAYRYRETCRINEDGQDEAELQRGCDTAAAASNPSAGVVLWGDSYAAQLVPGIEATIGNDANLYVFSVNGCRPLLEQLRSVRAGCNPGNRFALNFVRQYQPREVLIAANWNGWSQYRDQYTNVEQTIRELKGYGIPRVVLLGSFAQFERPVPLLLVDKLKRGAIPRRLATPLMPTLMTIDSTLSAIAIRTGAEFVSPLAAQCSPDGCLVSLDGSIDSVTTWDRFHLTLVGSKFIAEQMLRPYLHP